MLLRTFDYFLHDAVTSLKGPGHDFALKLMESLGGAMRFRFNEHAAAAADQITARPEQIDAARGNIIAPWPRTWIDFDGESHAVLWQADRENQQAGVCTLVERWVGGPCPLYFLPLRVDLARPNYIWIAEATEKALERDNGEHSPHLDIKAMRAKDVPLRIGRMMLGAFALLASKGMTHSVEADMTKLNRGRQSRGQFPLLAYTEIRLNLDAERAVKARSAVATGAMPQHPVRAHLRLLQSGKVAIIPAHMRGNPLNGIRSHSYNVGTADDFEAASRKPPA